MCMVILFFLSSYYKLKNDCVYIRCKRALERETGNGKETRQIGKRVKGKGMEKEWKSKLGDAERTEVKKCIVLFIIRVVPTMCQEIEITG